MAGAIYLEGHIIPAEFTGAGHLYLVYKDATGAEYLIRGGPELNFPPWGDIEISAGDLLSSHPFDARGSDTPQDRGQIALDLGARDAADVWTIMLEQARDIGAAGLDYDLLGTIQNSNSVVATVLNAVGLNLGALPNAVGVTNGYPGSGTLLALDYDLHDTASADILRGHTGDDQFTLTSGADQVSAGVGSDTVVILDESRADAQVTVSGATRTIVTSGSGTKTLTDVETVIYTGLSDVGSNTLLPFGANVLFRNDDSSSPFINLASIFEQGIDFNGNEFTGLYVNTNGNVTFEGPLGQFTPAVIGNGSQTIIAPFWGDVDTRLPSVGTNGNVYWDFNTQRDSFVVTWSNVGYYHTHVDKLNTFQLELVDQGGGNFEIIYRFADINWTTGDASGGTEGLGGTIGRSGFSSGNGLYFELPGSGNQASVLNWENAPGNTGVSGVWQFQVMSGALQNVGTSGDDTFTGGNGDDYYFGGAGNDSCTGGLGNDRFYGGEGDDYLFGGDGDDWIDGGIGFDWLVAGSGGGNDHYDGGDDTDLISFTSTSLGVIVDLAAGTASGQEIGNDVIINVENVIGGRGADSLIGNALANALTGGRGKDRLEGGAGADIFDFDHKLDSKTGGQRDIITDFERGLDHIDLSTIDAVKGAGDQAFKWIGKKDFTGTAGELHFVKKGSSILVEGDIDGNGKADFQIQLNDLGGIGKGDFIL